MSKVGITLTPGKDAVIPGLAFQREDIERSVPGRFEKVAERYPDSIALTGDGRQWTYADLNRWTNRLAHAIGRAAPSGPGCIAFLVEQSPQMVAAALAILKAGKAYLGIHPEMPAAAQTEIVVDAAPELVLTTIALQARARAIAGDVKVLIIDEVDERYPDGNPGALIRPQDPAIVFYTSGTTGKPKGVFKSHRAVLHRVWLSTQYDAIVPADRQSLLTHVSFSASESDMFGALLQAARVCVFPIAAHGFAAFRGWIEAEAITLLHPPVLLFRRFLSTLDSGAAFPSVRLVALAGDVVLPQDLERWKRHFTGSLLHRFSTAETALLTVSRIEHDDVPAPGTVAAGKPAPDKILELVDSVGRPAPPGETGELVVRSRYLADGYWRHPRESAAAFQRDPDRPEHTIYRTGDLGRFLPDGTFVFVGRREHLAKIRGYRVDTREVESAIADSADVAGAAVVVRKADDEDRLSAFVVMKDGIAFDAARIRGRLRERLPEWKIPDWIEALPALPLTLSGKIDRQMLQSITAKPRADAAALPDFTLEEELADIWTVTLRRDTVSVDDHFLDLGGDSISAMMTLNWIERLYGVRITPANFYKAGTIRQLAVLIAGSRPSPPPVPATHTVSDAYVEMLNAHGVDCIFINPGTDTAPILESIAKFQAQGRRTPRLVLCLHESVAMAAAHGYYMITGRAQVALVHVDVGTQNIGANLHNAQRGRAGVVICAGKAPYTMDGVVAGGRNRYNHWIQEQYNQAGIVQGYVKWHYELTRGQNLSMAVRRAFQMAAAEPAGPVYLTLPREVLMEQCDVRSDELKTASPPSAAAADATSLGLAAQWLIEADDPLLLVAYAGRNPDAVAALIRLTELLAIPVVESRQRMNFPSDHPLHLGYSAARALPQADCVLVVDHDVPWIPAQGTPSAGARIIHIDYDALKRDIPLWGFPVDLAIQADSSIAIGALAAEIERRLTPADRARVDARRGRIHAEHRAQSSRQINQTRERAEDKPIAPDWAAHCLNQVVDEDTLLVSEAVTSSPAIWKHLKLKTPGTYFQSLGSGLGWALGAALGAKLASRSKTVICIVGDGSWIFGNPIAAYWAAQQNQSPFLTVVFNNQQYFATVEAILAAAPEGSARKSGHYPACDLPQPPMYTKVAEALGLWARTVEEPSELTPVLREALSAVRGGRCALVDICVSAPRPDPGVA